MFLFHTYLLFENPWHFHLFLEDFFYVLTTAVLFFFSASVTRLH